ncbi:hypothetical protein [Nocardiopsis alkaliphila]|uniref:hypothetical protein n=1 Tax=Nocardiopsis alkaliphila TaxID=225762 RepID=UPI00035FC991|nr:hypothetical protein [Nocardiopsis alkaliphila]
MTLSDNKEEKEILGLLQQNTGDLEGRLIRKNFESIMDRITSLWITDQKNNRAWTPEYREKVATLLRKEGNRHGFQMYMDTCETYSLRNESDGFPYSCEYRSRIQIILDEFVSFEDLVHPADTQWLEENDQLYREHTDQIPPIPIPSWVPETHWWWNAPTNHNMSQDEIDEKLGDYFLPDFLGDPPSPSSTQNPNIK